jgi:hypothetical protein
MIQVNRDQRRALVRVLELATVALDEQREYLDSAEDETRFQGDVKDVKAIQELLANLSRTKPCGLMSL